MDVALGKTKATLVLKHCRIVNVYNKEIEEADIAITDGHIVGIGTYQGIEEHDMHGCFVAPGLIDGHVHIESSMVTPPGFARLVVPKGTTTVIADPHEIANVSGLDGISFMLKESENIPLNVHMMLPSCVPATEGEHSGAVLKADDLETLKDHPGVLGLGEVMDYPAVIHGDKAIHDKIELMRQRMIDGHAPDIIGKPLSAYAAAGIAGSNPFKTGNTAFMLGIAKALVPFVFVYSPSLLLVADGFSWSEGSGDNIVNIDS